MRSLILGLCATCLTACAPSNVAKVATQTTTVSLGTSSSTIDTYTDIDDVRDVASSDGRVLVATDYGLLVYAVGSDAPPNRVTIGQGLPSNDVTAVTLSNSGDAIVATANGFAAWNHGGTQPMGSSPVGRVQALDYDGAGNLWACGRSGLAKRTQTDWKVFGDPLHCVDLQVEADGTVWVSTTRGVLRIEGDTVREYGHGAFPFVRSLVPLGADGEGASALALLSDRDHTVLAYFDGRVWYSYTLHLDRKPLALVKDGDQAILVVAGAAFVLQREDLGESIAWTPHGNPKPVTVRSFRGDLRDGNDVAFPALNEDDLNSHVRRDATPLVRPTENRTEAPVWFMKRASLNSPGDAVFAKSTGKGLFVATANRGIRASLPSGEAWLRTNDAVTQEMAQVATHSNGDPFVLVRRGEIARLRDERLRRVPFKPGFRAAGLAQGPDGVYVAAIADGTEGSPSRIAVFRWTDAGWAPHSDHEVPNVAELSLMDVTESRDVWVGIKTLEQGRTEARSRGAALLSPQRESAALFHRGVTKASTSQSMAAPDHLSRVDASQEGYAWFASIEGAIRIGNSQVVVFGESRGVRGEAVSDLAVTPAGRVWIAAAEGLGYYEGKDMNFMLPSTAREAKPWALTLDASGRLWAVGRNGLLLHEKAADGTDKWSTYGKTEGLPDAEYRDIRSDARNNLWLLSSEGLHRLSL